MGERERPKETIERGELYFLGHPGTSDTFSGYGLTVMPGSKEFLVGLLMVDRPQPADPAWLQEVEDKFGECELVPMTAAGARGLVCQMQIEPNSLAHLRQFPGQKAAATQEALQPLLNDPPQPLLTLQWDENSSVWRSSLLCLNELSPEICQAFEQTGYGCLAAETNVGIVHICHAPDGDIEGFRGKPVVYQWQFIPMPTAPLIRLEMRVLDDPDNPFRFESFLNSADDEQAKCLTLLAQQDQLNLAFYGDNLHYRFTKLIAHDTQRQAQLADLAQRAADYWAALPPEQRDFDQAKWEFMRRFQ